MSALHDKYAGMTTEQLHVALDSVEFTWRGDEQAIRDILHSRHEQAVALEDAILNSR